MGIFGNLANRLSKVADVPVAFEDGLPRFICIYHAKTNLCQESILEQQPRLLTKRTNTPISLPLVVIHKSRSQIRELRIQVVLGHLLRLGSSDAAASF